MRISFDLDETLLVSGGAAEPPAGFPWSLIYMEHLRKGTVALLKKLSASGWEIYIYTTSQRTVSHIKGFFRSYGIRLAGVINQRVHQNTVQAGRVEVMPSKLPSRFGINLHVDDDITVKQNGVQHGFDVLLVEPGDEAWAEKVLAEAARIRKKAGI